MPTGSGLDGQIGFVTESAWGTALTVTRFPEFNSESLKREVTWLEPTGLRVGTKAKRVSRIRQARKWATGDVEMDVLTLGMGLFVKHMLGSTVTTPTLISGTAYKQIHTPGDFRGLGLTVQVGRPEPSTGTVRPFTYPGCKVTGWEFSVEDSAYPKLKLTLDGRNEDTATALATASYLAGAAAFDFSQAVIKLGGTATTASGETTIAGGTDVATSTVVKSFSISGETPMDTERFGIGNAGLKSEPLENGTPTYSGNLGAEFNKATLYDLFANNTTFPLQMDMTGAVIGGANSFLFSVICPAVKLKSAAPNVNGPEIVQMASDFEVYNDESNPTVQIKIVSTESATI